MAANLLAASSVFVAGTTNCHRWGREETMFGQDGGISPASSGMLRARATLAKYSSGVANVKRLAPWRLTICRFSASLSLGGYRSLPQLLHIGLLGVPSPPAGSVA